MDLEEFRKKSLEQKSENSKFFKALKKKRLKHLDEVFHEAHDFVFNKTDCLSCANCCKTTSPIFKPRDIKRIAKNFRIKESQFIDQYLFEDEDEDFVLKSSPCVFLDDNNYCGIYEIRPDACREFPHTNRRKMNQILPLTERNTLVCPAVLEITERIKIKL